MDVKEAITQLTGLKKYCEGMAECDESGSYVFDLDVQALDMAISALSPPNEPLTIEQRGPRLEQVKRERMRRLRLPNGLDKMIGRAWGED